MTEQMFPHFSTGNVMMSGSKTSGTCGCRIFEFLKRNTHTTWAFIVALCACVLNKNIHSFLFLLISNACRTTMWINKVNKTRKGGKTPSGNISWNFILDDYVEDGYGPLNMENVSNVFHQNKFSPKSKMDRAHAFFYKHLYHHWFCFTLQFW